MKKSCYCVILKSRFLLCFILSAVTLIIIASSAFLPVSAKTDESVKHVLIISSYSPAWPTVPKQIDGIYEKLCDTAELEYYFMDTKVMPTEFAETELAEVLDEHKKQGDRYDAVILMDDAAVDFAMKNNEKYFSGMPVFFEAVNSMQKAEKAHREYGMTGVVEAFPIRETISLARTLYPDAKTAVIITDDTSSGKGSTEQYMDAEQYFPDLKFSFLNTSEMTDREIKTRLSSYGTDSMLFYAIMSNDSSGRHYTNSSALRMIRESASIPVFKSDELGVGEGIIGGCVISYNEIGARTGSMVKSVLEGKSIASISIETASPRYLFDMRELKRYGINRRKLPVGSSVINNESPAFVVKYWQQLLTAGLAAMLAILIISMAAARRNRKKLEAACRQAEEANNAKGDFLSRMSHDMRTPLNGILGLTRLMSESDDINEIRNDLNKVSMSGKYLLNLINDTLDVSKIESGKMELNPSVCSGREILTHCAEMVGPEMKTKNISFNVVIDEMPYDILYIDYGRVQQLVMNLLGNAVKYTATNGNVTFTAATLSCENNEICERIMVRDDGAGMSSEFVPHLFEPFSQEKTAANSKNTGTGLGMTICKNIVDLMKGTIKVKSRPGEGTEFVCDIYLQTASEEQKREYLKINKKIVDAAVPNGMHVLMCEDNELNAEIAMRLMMEKNVIVDWAVNGEEGIKKLTAAVPGSYDLILMDIRMPVMDGYEAAERIRGLGIPGADTIPIIALSADAFNNDISRSAAAGMNDYITKPIDPDTLFSKISEYCTRGNDLKT